MSEWLYAVAALSLRRDIAPSLALRHTAVEADEEARLGSVAL